MRERLTLTCSRNDCDRDLTSTEFRLSYASGDVRRCAYECQCGAVTMTVAREPVPP